MSGPIILDSGPWGLVTQRPGKSQRADDCQAWLHQVIAKGRLVYVPEIVDYEVRREISRAGNAAGLQRMDVFLKTLEYLPINTPAIRLAADLWGQIRNANLTTAHPHALDGDVILCAQVLSWLPALVSPVVATVNAAHISRFLPADLWENITP